MRNATTPLTWTLRDWLLHEDLFLFFFYSFQHLFLYVISNYDLNWGPSLPWFSPSVQRPNQPIAVGAAQLGATRVDGHSINPNNDDGDNNNDDKNKEKKVKCEDSLPMKLELGFL